MSSLTYHRKPNGVTYVYHQESYWDKEKKQSSSRQVCVGKLDESGQIIYNQRFKTPEAREALERGETVAESINIGQSLILAKATRDTGLERVLYRSFESKEADVLLSLAWAVATGLGPMNLAGVWLEQNDCPVHKDPPSPFDIARILASVSQSQIENFLGEWTKHRKKGQKQQYCYDLPLMSSPDMSNPFDDWDDNCDGEDLAQINMILLTGVNSQIPTYYEIDHGSMLDARSDTKTIVNFIRRMKKYGLERIRLLLDGDFYSAMNISRLLEASIRFSIPVPTTADWSGQFIDLYRDEVEMPEHVLSFSEDECQALYGMTVLDHMDGHRVWKHLYFDSARRIAHIISLFAALRRWEDELLSGETNEKNKWAYERYFTVKTTPKRGLAVRRNQEAINTYKRDRAGYWVILSSCEKEAKRALEAYDQREQVKSQLEDMKKDLAMSRVGSPGPKTRRGRTFVQFLSLILTARMRVILDSAWKNRLDIAKEERLLSHYSLEEMMLLLGTYRKTSFSNRSGPVVSSPTKAQLSIFRAFGISAG